MAAAPDRAQSRPSAERFCAWALSSLTSGVLGIDSAGRLVLANADALRVLRLPPDAAPLGRPQREVLAGQPGVAAVLEDVLERETPVSRAELALAGAEELPGRTIGYSAAPVRDAEGVVRGAVLVFRDLTPIERRDERERLRERLAALGEMAAGLAHALRNPLAGMEVAAGLLRRRLAGRPGERELAEQIVAELRRAAAAVTRSLEFVRPASRVRSRVDLAALLDEALAGARARAPGDCHIECVVDPALPELVADADALRTAFSNLATNAFEAMAEADTAEPRLRVRARAAGSEPEVVVTLADNGPGVPPELREKVFYPFFTTRAAGSGIGLAQAQKLVASHGGSLELGGGEEPGCTFRVRLPAGGERPA